MAHYTAADDGVFCGACCRATFEARQPAIASNDTSQPMDIDAICVGNHNGGSEGGMVTTLDRWVKC